MRIEHFGIHRATNEAEVARFEAALGARLPSDYRGFLLGYNGGCPFPGGFRGGDEAVDHFFGLGCPEDLEEQVRSHRGFIPAGTIPIGADGNGNLILLGVAEPNQGGVWFWDHEQASDPSYTPSLEASSFAEFVDAFVE